MSSGIAVVTGASTGIGYELAVCAAHDGYDLLVAADEPGLHDAAARLGAMGVSVDALVVDLATDEGRDALWKRIGDLPVDLFFANAGRALGNAFHEQSLTDVYRVIDLNVVQTTILLHRMVIRMKAHGRGRILVTGSIGGFVPGPYDAVYNASKAYLDSLSVALREEIGEGPPSLTCLMPGPTDTPIFERAGMGDAPISDSNRLEDPAVVARSGYEAMLAGRAGVVPGLPSRLVTMFSGVIPKAWLAQVHARYARPSSD